MNFLCFTVVLGLLLGVQAQYNVLRPMCDSSEAEEAAMAAQDYLNGQHAHGYKYALNRIEDIKVLAGLNGDNTYILEIDLLETNCHVLDPTPLANCIVRPKMSTALEGDCDVVLKRVGGVLTVTAFKCKTEESTEDLCIGCSTLLPLSDTASLEFVQASLATFNNNTVNVTYTVLEVGRMSSQVVSGGTQYIVEYVVVEANCTDDACVPLADPMAEHGICSAWGVTTAHKVDCKMFPQPMMPAVDADSTVAAAPEVHVHTSSRQGVKHHKLTSFYDPEQSGLLSAESAESAEIVPVVPAAPTAADPAPTAAGTAPTANDTAPTANDTAPTANDTAPTANDTAPTANDTAPTANDTAPTANDTAPTANDTAPTADDPTDAAPTADDPTDAAPSTDDPTDAASNPDDSSSKEVPVLVFKRDIVAVANSPAAQTGPISLVPVCPGRVRFFS